MLASVRFFLRFIDLEETFDRYGFEKKVCCVFDCTFKLTMLIQLAFSSGPRLKSQARGQHVSICSFPRTVGR